MKTVRTVFEMRKLALHWQSKGRRVSLVPTMGCLHDGHLSLVRQARGLSDQIVVSIFVNPTQFGEDEDLDAYPRDLSGDVEKLRAIDPDCVVFSPSDSEMYPAGQNLTWVNTDGLTDHLCGASRPGHFRGVQTVVTKLFNICRPDYALFGLKDVQQFYLIKRMSQDLNLSVEVIGVPIARESDGLAMSSRNLNLSPAERKEATVLFRAVEAARKAVASGERSGLEIEKKMQSVLNEAALGRIDYAQLVSSSDLAPVQQFSAAEPVIAAVAVYFERARLIDNAVIVVE